LPHSPFASGRWEYEHQTHFYFLESTEYRQIAEAQKHVFLIGHRGTGKTTLLRSLDWGERLTNDQLQTWFKTGAFEDGNIGCFVGLKSLDLQVFDPWLGDAAPSTAHLVLGAYFRAVWIEEAVRALLALRGSLGKYSLREEADALEPVRSSFVRWVPADLGLAPPPSDLPLLLETVASAAASLRDLLHGEAVLAFRKPEEVVAELGLGRLQQLTNDLFRSFANILATIRPDRVWRFRICMDEGEYLTDLARRSVRTFVRECESPLLLAVAALSDLGNETVVPGVPVGLDDREIINLDRRDVREFRSLINGIVAARSRALDIPEVGFDVANLLGNPSLDELLLSHRSESAGLAAVKERWSGWSATKRRAREGGPIRVFLEETGLIEAAEMHDPESARRLDSQGYRKYYIAGYLRLLGAAGVRTPFYAGWRPFAYMADNSVRDFLLALEMLKEIWWKSRRRPRTHLTVGDYVQFLSARRVNLHWQDSALLRLGRAKLDAFDQRVFHDTAQARTLLTYVGKASHALDFGALPDAAFSRLDSGKFVVRLPEPAVGIEAAIRASILHDGQARFVSLLRICAEEGYLKDIRVSESNGDVGFRLHHSLSRYYGCSYRTAVYTTRIPWSAIESVLESTTTTSVSAIVRSSLRRGVDPPTDQQRLV